MLHSQQIQKAIDFANGAFCAVGQRRRYTGEPYINHPIRVMHLLNKAELVHDTMRIATILHDCIEDTKITYEDIVDNFGKKVADLVTEVTDVARPEDGVRSARCAINRLRLLDASSCGKTIKLADIIDNCRNIVEHAPSFASTYLKEKQALLEVLSDGDARLYLQAKTIVQTGLNKLKENS